MDLLTSREAMAYTKRPSLKAFYNWRDYHHVRAFGNGLYSRAALDRGLRQARKAHHMAPASLANLRRRHAAA
jgi:hypothetical protein